MRSVNEGFKSIRDNLKNILNSNNFNKDIVEDCFYKLDSYIEQFIDDLFYKIDLEEYTIIYPISRLRGYCLYIILSDNISNNEYRTIIECTLEILDENLEFIEKIYKEKF